jgi:hypothetical protein
MLSTDYNKRIAEQTEAITRRYIHNDRVRSNDYLGDETAVYHGQNRGEMLRHGLRPLYDGQNLDLKGAGFLSGLAGMLGLGQATEEEQATTANALVRRGMGKYGMFGLGEAKAKSKSKGKKGKKGSGILSDVLGSIGLGETEDKIDDLEGSGILSGLLGAVGLGQGNLEGGMSLYDSLTLSKKDKDMRSLINDIKSGKLGNGKKKKSSKWIEHVKAYAKKHNLKYSEALKKAKASYKA